MSDSERLSRRRFLGLLGAAATTAIACSPRRPPVVTVEPASNTFDEEHDVVVVGGGVIGGCAALFAREAGAQLFARVGTQFCYNCGRRVQRQTVDQIIDSIQQFPAGSKIQILAPVVRGRKGHYRELFAQILKDGL